MITFSAKNRDAHIMNETAFITVLYGNDGMHQLPFRNERKRKSIEKKSKVVHIIDDGGDENVERKAN